MKSRSDSKSLIHFVENFVKSKLLYYVNTLTELRKLCIWPNCVENILKIAYDEEHLNFVRCFQLIFKAWYIKEFIKHLKIYIRDCSNCFVLQTKRHSSYENLQFIEFSLLSFYIITMNFILTLSLSV